MPSLIAEWVTWIAEAGEQYPPIVRAALAHHGFEAVHPFEDGNGRTGRLLLNLILMRSGYPPALLLRDWRLGYIQALSSADSGSYRAFTNLIGRVVEGGLDLYLAACEAEPDSEYLKLDELAKRTGYAAPHLGWLIRQGRLEAVKRSGRTAPWRQWSTTSGKWSRGRWKGAAETDIGKRRRRAGMKGEHGDRVESARPDIS